MVNVKGRYKAHGSEQQEFCIFKKQKKQKGEPKHLAHIFLFRSTYKTYTYICTCTSFLTSFFCRFQEK